MRFFTNTRERFATIERELEYLGQYFCLLKSRYKHKLNFTVEVDSGIYGRLRLPADIQELPERLETKLNCVYHRRRTELMKAMCNHQRIDASLDVTRYFPSACYYAVLTRAWKVAARLASSRG